MPCRIGSRTGTKERTSLINWFQICIAATGVSFEAATFHNHWFLGAGRNELTQFVNRQTEGIERPCVLGDEKWGARAHYKSANTIKIVTPIEQGVFHVQCSDRSWDGKDGRGFFLPPTENLRDPILDGGGELIFVNEAYPAIAVTIRCSNIYQRFVQQLLRLVSLARSKLGVRDSICASAIEDKCTSRIKAKIEISHLGESKRFDLSATSGGLSPYQWYEELLKIAVELKLAEKIQGDISLFKRPVGISSQSASGRDGVEKRLPPQTVLLLHKEWRELILEFLCGGGRPEANLLRDADDFQRRILTAHPRWGTAALQLSQEESPDTVTFSRPLPGVYHRMLWDVSDTDPILHHHLYKGEANIAHFASSPFDTDSNALPNIVFLCSELEGTDYFIHLTHRDGQWKLEMKPYRTESSSVIYDLPEEASGVVHEEAWRKVLTDILGPNAKPGFIERWGKWRKQATNGELSVWSGVDDSEISTLVED